ncbi:MAG: hypothetical protein Q4A60_06325 [Pasteurellaceae bacterium]|nr:hypothetical protein [Pasteurellaceae bacterium]
MNVDNCTQNGSFWQQLEYRKRCYQALELHHFAANVDYAPMFEQIDKELSDECTRKD